MKNVEELKGMTHEDLILLVQELEESVEKHKKDSLDWYCMWQESKKKYEDFRNLIKGIITLAE